MPQDPNRQVSIEEWEERVRQQYGIPEALWKGMAEQESGGDWNAKSPTGVRGKYQVTKATAKQYGYNRDNPFEQTAAAAVHLRTLYDSIDLPDENARWWGALAKYYGGNDAIDSSGNLRRVSVDNLSDPMTHVNRVAERIRKMSQPQEPVQAPVQPPQPESPIRPGTLNENFSQWLGKQRTTPQEVPAMPLKRPAPVQNPQQPRDVRQGFKQWLGTRPEIAPPTPPVAPVRPASAQPAQMQAIMDQILNERSPVQQIERGPIQEMPTPAVGSLRQSMNQFAQTIGTGLARIPQGIATLGEEGAKAIYPSPSGVPQPAGRGPISRIFDKPTQQAVQQVEAQFPTNKADQSWLGQKIPSALGSMALFAGTSALGGTVGLAPSVVTALTGAGMEVGGFLEEVRQTGIDPKRVNRGVLMAGATGMTELFGLGRMLDKFGVKKLVVERGLQIAEEAGQEAFQGYLSDLNAKLVAANDPNRNINPNSADFWLKRGEEAALGAIGGGLFGGVDILTQRIATRADGGAAKVPDAVQQETTTPLQASPAMRQTAPVGTEPMTGPPGAPEQAQAPDNRTAALANLSSKPEALKVALEQAEQAQQQFERSLESGRVEDAVTALRRKEQALREARNKVKGDTPEGLRKKQQLWDEIQSNKRQIEQVQAEQKRRKAQPTPQAPAPAQAQPVAPAVDENAPTAGQPVPPVASVPTEQLQEQPQELAQAVGQTGTPSARMRGPSPNILSGRPRPGRVLQFPSQQPAGTGLLREPTNRIDSNQDYPGGEVQRTAGLQPEGQPVEAPTRPRSPIPQLPPEQIERRRQERAGTRMGVFGKLSERAHKTNEQRDRPALVEHPELRELLGLPPMPPYKIADETGEERYNKEWQVAAQDTLNSLAILADVGRSSEIDPDALRGVYASLRQTAQRYGREISDDLKRTFKETFKEYQSATEGYQNFIVDESIVNIINGVRDAAARGQQLDKRELSKLKANITQVALDYGLAKNFAAGWTDKLIRRFYNPEGWRNQIPLEAAPVPRNEAGAGRRTDDDRGRDVRLSETPAAPAPTGPTTAELEDTGELRSKIRDLKKRGQAMRGEDKADQAAMAAEGRRTSEETTTETRTQGSGSGERTGGQAARTPVKPAQPAPAPATARAERPSAPAPEQPAQPVTATRTKARQAKEAAKAPPAKKRAKVADLLALGWTQEHSQEYRKGDEWRLVRNMEHRGSEPFELTRDGEVVQRFGSLGDAINSIVEQGQAEQPAQAAPAQEQPVTRGRPAPVGAIATPPEGAKITLDTEISRILASGTFGDIKQGDTTAIINLKDGEIHLISLRTPSKKQRQGSAAAMLKSITDYADKHGIPIVLEASPLDKSTSLKRLVQFYRKHGFELTGRTANAAGDPEMRRVPTPAPEPEAATPAATATPPAPEQAKEPWQMTREEFLGEGLPAYKGLSKVNWKTGEPIRFVDATRVGKRVAGYFSSDKAVAERFARVLGLPGSMQFTEARIVFERPYEVDARGRPAKEFMTDALNPTNNHPELVRALESPAYDGLIIRNTSDEGTVYVPKTAQQIRADITHRAAIEQALSEGKPVPAEVLADYPDLQAQPKAQPEQAKSKQPDARFDGRNLNPFNPPLDGDTIAIGDQVWERHTTMRGRIKLRDAKTKAEHPTVDAGDLNDFLRQVMDVANNPPAQEKQVAKPAPPVQAKPATAKAKPKKAAQPDLAAMFSEKPTGSPWSLRDFKERLRQAGVPDAAMDEYILQESQADVLSLLRHDFPAILTEEEKSWMVKDPYGNWYVGVSLRPEKDWQRAPSPLPLGQPAPEAQTPAQEQAAASMKPSAPRGRQAAASEATEATRRIEDVEITIGDKAAIDKAKPQVVFVIREGTHYFTLWAGVRLPDGRIAGWNYMRNLSGTKADAIASAEVFVRDIATGKGSGLSFTTDKARNLGTERYKSYGLDTAPWTAEQLMASERGEGLDVGEQSVGFGKHANVQVKDLFAKDANYAMWAADNLTSGRGKAIGDYLRRRPEYIEATQAASAQLEQAMTAEVLATLQQFGMTAQARGANILLGGKTYDYKDIIKQAGGRYADEGWTIAPNSLSAVIDKLRGLSSTTGRPAGVVRDLDKDSRIAGLRQMAEQRPDRSGFDKPIGEYVSQDTQALLKRGIGFGMPADVVTEQIEDVAKIRQAYERDTGVFLLASEPGSGKTFVLGAAIRELQQAGAKKIVYVTLRKELITQIKEDLDVYGIGDVQFVTYPEMRAAGVQSSDVLIFDEAHSVKNVSPGDEGAQQAKAAAAWIDKAKMTIFSTATPFENPTQAAYLEPTGIFAPFGGFKEFAQAFGGIVKKVLIKTKRGTQEIERVEWRRNDKSDEDARAAREFFRKEGIFTSRPIRLSPDMVDVRLSKVEADKEASDLYAGLASAAELHEDNLRMSFIAKSWIVNLQKRILEAAKVDRGIQEARSALERGRFPILFVETKAERTIDIPDILAKEDAYNRARAIAAKTHDTPPKRSEFGLPPEFIPDVLKSFMLATGRETIDIPAAETRIVGALGENNVAIFTGSVSPAKAQQNLDAWRRGDKKVIVATMAKGGTGLSLHDKAGNHPTTQIVINLPWTATQVKQVAQRNARYGLKSKAEINWIFADNIPFDRMLASRVGGRMSDMGATVYGDTIKEAQRLENWDIGDMSFSALAAAAQEAGPTETVAAPQLIKKQPNQEATSEAQTEAVQAPEGPTPARRSGEQLSQPVIPSGRTSSGRAAQLVIPRTKTKHEVRYEVRELGDLIPSHNPFSFEPNPDYQLTNDRDYRNPANRMDVEEATKPGAFMPDLVINTDPTATNGPPIIMPNGTVLGGNSRTMMLARAYRGGDGVTYRRALAAEAATYGIDPASLDRFDQPVLVRVMAADAKSVPQWQKIITDLNVQPGKAMTGTEAAIARAKGLPIPTMDFLARKLNEEGPEGTLAQALTGYKGINVLNRLIQDGVIPAGDRNRYISDAGNLTPAAKDEIEQMILGSVFRDADQMKTTAPVIRNKLVRVAPQVAKLASSEWDIVQHLPGAIDAVRESISRDQDFDMLVRQEGMFATGPTYTAEEIALARWIKELGPRQLENRFREYVAAFEAGGQTRDLFGSRTQTPAEAFRDIFKPDYSQAPAAKPRVVSDAAPFVEPGKLNPARYYNDHGEQAFRDLLQQYDDKAIQKIMRTRSVRVAGYTKEKAIDALVGDIQKMLVSGMGVSLINKNEPRIVADARQRVRKGTTGEQANVGIQPLLDQALVTGYDIYKAGVTFAQWSRRMLSDLGQKVRPYLRQTWDKVRAAVAEAARRPGPTKARERAIQTEAGVLINREWLGSPLAKHRTSQDAAGEIKIRVSKAHPNVVYGNPSAHFFVDAALKHVTRQGGQSFAGANIPPKQATQIADALESLITRYKVKPAARQAIQGLAGTIRKIAQRGEDVLWIRASGDRRWKETRATVYHELSHTAERRYRTLKGWFDAQPIAAKLKQALTRRGYKPHQFIAETVAHIMGGQRKRLGLSQVEALDWIESYWENVQQWPGNPSIEEVNPRKVAPSMRAPIMLAQENARARRERAGIPAGRAIPRTVGGSPVSRGGRDRGAAAFDVAGDVAFQAEGGEGDLRARGTGSTSGVAAGRGIRKPFSIDDFLADINVEEIRNTPPRNRQNRKPLTFEEAIKSAPLGHVPVKQPPPFRVGGVSLRSPLSNLNVVGTYEAVAGPLGKQISDAFRSAHTELAYQTREREVVMKDLRKTLKPLLKQAKADGFDGIQDMVYRHLYAIQNPDQTLARTARVLTSFQYNTKLRWNPRSILLNWLQPFQTLWPHFKTGEFIDMMLEAHKPETRQKFAEIALRESGGKVEGMDETKREQFWRNPFAWTSETNRIMGHLAGNRVADRLGLTGFEKQKMAAAWAEKVEFDNSMWNVPPLFRGNIARILGQFKPYAIKNIERLHADWKNGLPETGSGKYARRAKMIAAQVGLGGVGSVLLPGVKSIAGVLILGSLAKALMAAGMPEDEADKMAEIAYFGLPALVAQDLSSSVAILDEPFGQTPQEQAVGFLGGPTASTLWKLTDAGADFYEGWQAEEKPGQKRTPTERMQGAALKAAKTITPYVKTGQALYAASKGETPKMWLGKEEPMTKTEAVGFGLMGTPLRQSRYYEEKDAYDWQKKLLGRPVDIPGVKRKDGEPEEIYKIRAGRVQQWTDKYESEMEAYPRFQALPEPEKERARESLRKRISEEAAKKSPDLGRLDTPTILRSLQSSGKRRSKRNAKLLYVEE